MLRPYNYPPPAPGRGLAVYETSAGKVAVLNLLGRIFMEPVDCPFRAADRALSEIGNDVRVILVDMHGEATSEKRAMGWYLDGRVSLVFGSHTHVPTADEEVLPKGTAYVTDVGMTGPYHSVIGTKVEKIIERFLSFRPTAFDPADGDVQLRAVLVDVDPQTGRAQSIERLKLALTSP